MQCINRTSVERLLIHECTCIQKHKRIHFQVSKIYEINQNQFIVYQQLTIYRIKSKGQNKILDTSTNYSFKNIHDSTSFNSCNFPYNKFV